MKKFLSVSIMFLMYFTFFGVASAEFPEKAVNFTQADRDRLIKLEVRVDEGFKNVNQRIENLESRMYKMNDDLKSFMFWGFGILFTFVVFLIGFVLWDRRTAIAPVAKYQKKLQERVDELEKKGKET
ncbi:exported hypothetical protein [Candidatus Magnetomoraceae bacterium gMMP-15]